MEAAASRDSRRCALQLLGRLAQNSASATRRRKEVTRNRSLRPWKGVPPSPEAGVSGWLWGVEGSPSCSSTTRRLTTSSGCLFGPSSEPPAPT